MPVALEIRPELPKTPVGKLSKKELKEEERAKAQAKRLDHPPPLLQDREPIVVSLGRIMILERAGGSPPPGRL